MTKWIKRCAARFTDRTGLTGRVANEFARNCFEFVADMEGLTSALLRCPEEAADVELTTIAHKSKMRFDIAGYRVWPGDSFDAMGNVIDVNSHPSHAMNPFRGVTYNVKAWELPPRLVRRFRCMFCGAVEKTAKAKRPCG